MEIISKELLSEVLGYKILSVKDLKDGRNNISFDHERINNMGLISDYDFINSHELAHKCILFAWDNNYAINPRVMGAEIVCLKTGYQKHIVQREDIENPIKFDVRFTFKACQWILENKE